MYSTISTFSFEAAHRLHDVNTYSDECRKCLHGHSYKLTVKVSRKELNDAGMVIDFKLLKKVVNDTIINVYDHSSILRDTDPITESIKENCEKVNIVEGNPTAEWMCGYFYYLLNNAFKELDPELIVAEIRVQETENNVASYTSEQFITLECRNDGMIYA